MPEGTTDRGQQAELSAAQSEVARLRLLLRAEAEVRVAVEAISGSLESGTLLRLIVE